MKISIFGGSHPQPGSQPYNEAYQLGKLLGGAGLTIMTGGYIGTMEAASHGAHDAGGHVIGVTCEDIENWRPVSPNQWIEEEWRCETLNERLRMLIEKCDVAIALPGGVGTLLEICLTWNQLAIQAIRPKPLILIGAEWHAVIETFFNQLTDYIPASVSGLITFAADAQSAFDRVSQYVDEL